MLTLCDLYYLSFYIPVLYRLAVSSGFLSYDRSCLHAEPFLSFLFLPSGSQQWAPIHPLHEERLVTSRVEGKMVDGGGDNAYRMRV